MPGEIEMDGEMDQDQAVDMEGQQMEGDMEGQQIQQ